MSEESNSSNQSRNSQLVYDIVIQILQHLYFNEDQKPDSASLARYALISKAWQLPAQVLLFHEVRIMSRRHLECIRSAFQTSNPRSRILRDAVRVLYISINGFGTDLSSVHIPPAYLPGILQLFPYLYELQLDIANVKHFERHVLNELKKSPPIQALRLTTHVISKSSVHIQLLRTLDWPLQHLVIEGGFIFDYAPTVQMPRCSLKSLAIRTFYSVAGNGPLAYDDQIRRSVSWILHKSQDTIEVLQVPLSSIIANEVAGRLLSIDCQNLPKSHEIKRRFSNIQELLWIWLPDLDRTEPSKHLVPPRLKHIGVRMAERRFYDNWRRWIDILSPTTKRLSLLGSPSQKCLAELSSLKNLQVRVYSDFTDYRKRKVSRPWSLNGSLELTSCLVSTSFATDGFSQRSFL